MAARRSNRRQFLQGATARDAIVDAADSLARESEASSEALPPLAPASYLVELTRRAMACQFAVYLNAGQHERGSEAALAALDLVDALEEQLSVYRESSELCHINRTAHLHAVSVEPKLFALLEQSVELYRQTEGAFDITAGPLSDVWGFKHRSGAIPAPDDLAQALARVGSHRLRLDAAEQTVSFDSPGIEINLGAIGKGYALDRAGEVLDAADVGDYMLHAGNSSVLARGSEVAAANGWAVGLRHPLRPQQRLGELRLFNRALSTSGSGSQFFEHAGRRYGHLLDPRSGWPAEGVLTATAIAPTAALAEAFSTALYVMGPAKAKEFCEQHPDIGAVLTVPGGRAGEIELVALNLDSEVWSRSTETA